MVGCGFRRPTRRRGAPAGPVETLWAPRAADGAAVADGAEPAQSPGPGADAAEDADVGGAAESKDGPEGRCAGEDP